LLSYRVLALWLNSKDWHVISELLYKMGEITHKVRFGLDWNRNMIFDDQSFDDMPHMELIDVE